MALILNLDEYKNETARKAAVRETIAKAIYDALSALCEKDDLIYIPDAIEPEGGTKICGGSIAVKAGNVTNKDGFLVDSVAIISVTAKSWEDKKTSRGFIPAVNMDDIRTAVNAESEARRAEKERKAKEKAEKIARDTKAREKKKAEKGE